MTTTFHLIVPAADEELAADRLWQLGVEAVGIANAVDGHVELWTSVGETAAALDRAVATLEDTWSWRTEEVVEPDDRWRSFAEPTWYRTDSVVVPAWKSDDAAIGAARHVTLIEPGTSFGLGDHPTTKLTLGMLADQLDSGNVTSLLDVGCGSGVLGVLAAQRGVRTVRAIDVSEGAVEATTANAAANGVDDLVRVDRTPVGAVDGQYDLVTANILAPVIISMAVDLRRLTSPTGSLLVSGILTTRHQHVVDALQPLRVVEQREEQGWAAIRFAR